MTGEINNLAALIPANPPLRAAMTAELLRLLQPQQALLAPGETAKAEVLTLRQVGQDFQMLLKLTLDNGKQTNVQA
ncbi:flagellar hook-length control protein FliK, partial [Pseudomonas frederiksbergensis]|nr:flagellar hook-length control protein FliK [Pseudomonas frederiksbergensis]